MIGQRHRKHRIGIAAGTGDLIHLLIIGAFLKKQYPFCGKRHLLIKDIEDEGTLGTIIRSVRGFEFNHLVLIHPQIDYYHPHVIRASMGSFFSTYLIVFPTIEAYQQAYPKQNIYYCQKNGTLPLNQLDKKLSPLSLCFAENKKTTNSIQINEQCSLENNVNIVLFHFYSS